MLSLRTEGGKTVAVAPFSVRRGVDPPARGPRGPGAPAPPANNGPREDGPSAIRSEMEGLQLQTASARGGRRGSGPTLFFCFIWSETRSLASQRRSKNNVRTSDDSEGKQRAGEDTARSVSPG
ncbi:hypothetical protein EYF80_054879 [Liparis tanakae]|uniref:Uncharacterized protein n=1 Tax=Liparis tanakae TaxID=230148 RepID=A0A4Z2F1W6_9TELE|nr:hypothetical protein EYF80_054879 [Liparis tanakae]